MKCEGLVYRFRTRSKKINHLSSIKVPIWSCKSWAGLEEQGAIDRDEVKIVILGGKENE